MDKTVDDLQRELKSHVENGNMYTLREENVRLQSRGKAAKEVAGKWRRRYTVEGMRSDADVERSATTHWSNTRLGRVPGAVPLSAANAEIGNLKRQLAVVTGGTRRQAAVRRVARKSNDNYPRSLEVVEEDPLKMMMMMMMTTRLQSFLVGTHLGEGHPPSAHIAKIEMQGGDQGHARQQRPQTVARGPTRISSQRWSCHFLSRPTA